MQTPPSRDISAQPVSQRHSPCVGVCQLDAATGWCRGCGRSGSEVAGWLGFSEDERLAVWEALPQRLHQLGIGVRLLPWTRDEIGRWVAKTLSDGCGTWAIGDASAFAQFTTGGGRSPDVVAGDDWIEARLPWSCFRLNLHDKLRAFGFGGEDGPVVLGLPKARATMPMAASLMVLGEDTRAIGPGHRAHMLFDLGAGAQTSRTCLRANDAELIATLTALAGQPGELALQEIGAELRTKRPHRIVESALARIEVNAPTEDMWLPKQASDAASELTLPDFALAVATYFPPSAGR